MPLDDADKKFILDSIKANNEELGKQFVTADQATKMVEQNLTKGLKDAGLDKVGDTLSGITTQLEELGKGGGKKKDGDGGKDKTDPAVARLQEELDNLKAQNQQAEQARIQAEESQRNTLLDNQLRAGLSKAGIPADRHDQAIAYLRTIKSGDGKPVLRFKDDGTPAYVAQRKGYVDELDIGAGVAEWGQTDSAKVYLPPKGGEGTGGGAGRHEDRRQGTVPRDKDGNLDWGALGSKVQIDPAAFTG